MAIAPVERQGLGAECRQRTESPVVLVKSARTIESFAVSLGGRCAQKYAPAAIAPITTTATPTQRIARLGAHAEETGTTTLALDAGLRPENPEEAVADALASGERDSSGIVVPCAEHYVAP